MDSRSFQFNGYSSSSFPSSSSTHAYDVFISFRGIDTRKNFTDHLHMALVQSGIITFRDEDELRKGEEISSELLNAIEGSKISVVVLSENYGYSRWSLDELVKIMDCRKRIGQVVLPVFYYVDPSSVRNQTGNFEAAFVAHEHRYGANTEKIMTWRAALTEVAELSGWDLQISANGYEARVIKEIVEMVLQQVRHDTKLHVAKYPVGLNSHNRNLKSLLSSRRDEVLFIGIYGMGGVGKTTIAKDFYNSMFCQYEARCFLADVRQRCMQTSGIVHLQNRLLKEIMMRDVKIHDTFMGISMLKQRLHSKKVLIVLDDVDKFNQIEALAGDRGWFGGGSIVILTTRNQGLLNVSQVDVKYEVSELNLEKSLTLFSWHAFKRPVPLPSYMRIVEDIVMYGGGLPLALEVLGASLNGRSPEEWESMLKKLKVIPHLDIQAKLTLSFDYLDNAEKDIFLDIAIFFIGMKKEYAIKILDGCGLFGEVGIDSLLSKCLLKISGHGTLEMHDLLQEMGREIVHESSPKVPGKQSRLWQQDDIVDVLNNDEGSENIEGIILDLPMQKHFSTRPFNNMPNLRLLKIKNVNLDGSFEGFSKELRWLCWRYCPLEIFPVNLHLRKLVCLDMKGSKLRILWNGIKFLGNLREMDLSLSEFLTATPDFSEVPNLEKLRFDGCKSLSNIDPSIGCLLKLITLDFGICKNLKSLPSTIGLLKSLKKLDVSYCSHLERLPEQLGDIKCLRHIDASHCGIRELPDSIGNMRQLNYFKLDGCKSLERLPISTGNMRSLQVLRLNDCSNLQQLPEQLENMRCLRKLFARGTGIRQLPHSIGLLHNLGKLSLADCNLSDGGIPNNLQGLSFLTDLNLSGNYFCSLPSSIAQLSHLEALYLRKCCHLQSIVDLPPNLRRLYANDCTSLTKLADLSNLNLENIELRNCRGLVEIQGLEYISRIDLKGCNPSVSTDALENFLLQGHFGLASLSELHLSRRQIPDCFQYQGRGGSAISFDVPDDSSHANIWITYDPEPHDLLSYTCDFIKIIIHNKTRHDKFSLRVSQCHTPRTGSCIVRVPYYYPIKSGDHIEVSFEIYDCYSKLGKCGVHIAYSSEVDIKDRV